MFKTKGDSLHVPAFSSLAVLGCELLDDEGCPGQSYVALSATGA